MKILLSPIYLIGGFNLFTLLMYIFAPYGYQAGNVLMSYAYIFINIIFLIVGYIFGIKNGGGRLISNGYSDKKTVSKIFGFILIFYSFTFLIKYAYLLKFNIFDVSGMINFLLMGLSDPMLAYKLTGDATRPFTVSWTIYFLISVINSIFFIVVFISWPSLSRVKKVFSLFFIILEFFYWAGRGTNFGIISIIVTLLFARLLALKKLNVKMIFYGFLAFLLSIVIFSLIMSLRGDSSYDLQAYALNYSYVDESSLLILLAPESLHSSLLLIFSYLVQGYYYMSLAFDLDFSSTWFGGSNPAIVGLYDFLGFSNFERSYVYRLFEFGIDPLINWHSAYTWYANDFSFFGVPFVMVFYGWFMGLTWANSINSNDLLSKILFLIFAPASIFLFANNNFIANYFNSLVFLVPLFLYRNFFSTQVVRVKLT